jgi:cold shock CspA family protein
MTEQEAQTFINLDEQDDVDYFVKYLGIDYDDYQLLKQDRDIDFDDWSR